MKGDINKVVEGNYCVGCGACAYASKGVMKINKYGEYVPDLTSEVFKDKEMLKKSYTEMGFTFNMLCD